MTARSSWIRTAAAALLALACPAGRGVAADAAPRVEVVSEFGDEGRWTETFVGAAAKTLVGMMANPDVAPPAVLHVQLKKDPNSAGVAGWSSTDGVGFTSASWPQDQWRLWIVAHELSNQFAAHYAGSGGFPSDWWSDGRSPFPEYAACLVLRATGHEDAAKWRQGVQAKQPDHALYWKLDAKHGFAMFAKFLRLLRADKVDLGAIGATWPSPDRVRSAYAVAYLSAAAGTNLAALFREHGVGREPSDWKDRHPEIPFVPYEVTAADVDAILAARECLFGKAADAAHFDALRETFRKGGAMNAAAPTVESPSAFRVTSDFGDESAWVRAFLEKAERALVERIGAPDRAPPKSVDVRLRLIKEVGGIGGGVKDGSLAYVSNAWPKEPFRLWILARDMAQLVFDHYGGAGFPEDLWTRQTFGDALASSVLRDVGEAPAADWLDKLLANNAATAAVRKFSADFGWKLFARFLAKLRSDGVELKNIGAQGPAPDRTRSLYAAAYLSMAAGENLAARLSAAGLGRRPDDWEARFPNVKFDAYEIAEADVASVLARREAVFAAGAGDDARARFRTGDLGDK